MKRLSILILLFILVSLSACDTEDTTPIIAREGRQVAESYDDNFKIILYSDKDIYSVDEEVTIWGTIEYIGQEDSIVIYSGEPYMGFTVEKDGIEYIQNIVLTLLKTTTLEKGSVYEFPLVKSGGFSEDDEDAEYWRDFYSEERMLFPEGEYELTFSTGFYINTRSDTQLTINYQFEVE